MHETLLSTGFPQSSQDRTQPQLPVLPSLSKLWTYFFFHVAVRPNSVPIKKPIVPRFPSLTQLFASTAEKPIRERSYEIDGSSDSRRRNSLAGWSHAHWSGGLRSRLCSFACPQHPRYGCGALGPPVWGRHAVASGGIADGINSSDSSAN